MLDKPNRHAIVDFVESLIGTPFHLQGRAPTIGLDCVGLIAVTCSKFGYKVDDILDYNLTTEVLPHFYKNFQEITKEEIQIGDILVFRLKGQVARHCGVVVSSTHLVHVITDRGTCASRLSIWLPRLIAAFTYRSNRWQH